MIQIIPKGLVADFKKELQETFTKYSSTSIKEVSEQSIKKVVDQAVRVWCYIYEKQRIQSSMSSQPFSYWVNIPAYEMNQKFRSAVPEFLPILKFRYTYFIDILEKYGYIEKNNSYSNLYHYTKSYRVCVEKMVDYDFYNQPKIYRMKEDWIREYPESKSLIENHYYSDLDIDGALKYIESMKGIGYKGRVVDDIRIFRWRRELYNIKQKHFWFSKSASGRFYSTYTNLPAPLRKFITFENKNLKTLDLKNAQPLFLAHLIKHDGMIEACKNGVFYEKILQNIPNLSRVKLKELVYKTILFDPKEIRMDLDFVKLVDRIFPEMIQKINEFKKDKKVWLELQKIESSIFIDSMKEVQFPYLTCHDSISVAPAYLQEATTKLKKELEKRGYECVIDID